MPPLSKNQRLVLISVAAGRSRTVAVGDLAGWPVGDIAGYLGLKPDAVRRAAAALSRRGLVSVQPGGVCSLTAGEELAAEIVAARLEAFAERGRGGGTLCSRTGLVRAGRGSSGARGGRGR